MRRIIIDTDTASDDAVALIMALQFPDIAIDAITVVSGNVSAAQASINARYTLELCGAEVPVYVGCDQPLQRKVSHADWFHGPDGMGDMNYPAPSMKAQPEHAVDALLARFKASPGEITLVTLGPLTNIATAIAADPGFASCVKHCYVMGGAACTVGNVTAAAEYNIWCDPEAALQVFHSGIPITMIGWELSCDAATLDDQELAALRALGTARAELAVDCNSHALRAVRELQGQAGLALADPVAMAIALDERTCTLRSSHFVDISCDAELTRGMTVVDKLNVSGNAPNVDVCWDLDAAHWKTMLRTALA